MSPQIPGRITRTVELFVDVSCPWCHGGLATVRRVLDELAAEPAIPAIAVGWRFIRLHDLEPPEGYPAAEQWERYGMNAEQGAAAEAELAAYLASVGIGMDTSRYSFIHNPLTAHRLLAMVRDDAATDTPDMWSLTRAVWTANFVRGTVMDDVAALRAALVDLGMAIPGRIWDRMADPDDHLAEALADRQRALDVNLDGVPRFYVDGHIIQAWHPIEDVETGLREALIGD